MKEEHREQLHVVEPSYTFAGATHCAEALIEYAGRTCYKSGDKIAEGTASEFIQRLIKMGHESVIEHATATVRYIGSRAMSHQLVRHRLAAYSQESQRYCDYKGAGLGVVAPPQLGIAPGHYVKVGPKDWRIKNGVVLAPTGLDQVAGKWMSHTSNAHRNYIVWRSNGLKPEDARFILPGGTATTVVVSMNFRTWRHVIKHRALNPRAQWEIRQITTALLHDFARRWPAVFGDLLCQQKD